MRNNTEAALDLAERGWRVMQTWNPTFVGRIRVTKTCWIWTGRRLRDGYGTFHARSKKPSVRAHRFAYQEAYGPIPHGLWVLHRCDVPLCVRPDHLFLGTAKDNAEDRDRKGRHRAGLALHPERAARGEAVGGSKLNPNSVREVRKCLAEGESANTIARALGVSKATIQDIRRGRTWRWLV